MAKDFSKYLISKDKFSIKKTSTEYEVKMTKDEGIALLEEEKRNYTNFRKNYMQTAASRCLLLSRLWIPQEKTV